MSLDNWKDWLNEKKDEKLKKSHLKKHIDSINKHINKLSTTNYTQMLKKYCYIPVAIMRHSKVAMRQGWLITTPQLDKGNLGPVALWF